MRGIALLGLFVGLLFSPRALATTGLEWKLDDAGVRYFLQAQVRLSEVMWFKADRNREVRVAEFQINVVTHCVPVHQHKNGWELRCDLEDFGIRAAPIIHEAGMLQGVLDEIDGKFEGAWAQVVFTTDGRVKNLHLEGVDHSNRRISEIHESLRLVLVRAFAGLDLQLPSKGDDKDKGKWKQKATLAMAFPSDVGTMGSASLKHEITGTEGSVVEITTHGRGTLGSGEMIVVNGVEKPANLYDMAMEGLARFDTARGVLVYREYIVDGTPTASSIQAEGFEGVPYVQAVRVQLIEPGMEVPPIDESTELEAVVHPGAPTPLLQRRVKDAE